MYAKRWRSCSLLLLLVSMISCGVLTFGWFSFPPTAWIIRNYFASVIEGNLEKALKYTDNATRRPSCKAVTREAALEDIAMFGGSEVRDVKLEVVGSGGSDQSLQVGRAYFTYKKVGESNWQEGYTQLLTSYGAFGFRYPCGKYP